MKKAENYNTGDAALDDARSADGIGEKELLAVSFGTSYNDSRRETIGAIERALEKAFPDWSVRRAFTSGVVIDHVAKRDGVRIDSVAQALDRAVKNGVKTLVVQPTHLMNGREYGKLTDTLARYVGAFESLAVGAPLLTSSADFAQAAAAVTGATAAYIDGKTAVVLMGHGTEAAANAVYAKLQRVLAAGGCADHYVGTVEAEPSLRDVLAALPEGRYRRVVLRPLMIVAGDHANNDMAGRGDGTWQTAFERAGYEVVCDVSGLGALPEIQDIFVRHARAAASGAG